MNNHAVYPGTFDPLTLGHLDLIERSAKIFDRLTVAVAATSVKKGAMFDLEERMQMITEACAEAGLRNIDVQPLNCLLVDFCRRYEKTPVVVRGLRVYSDFEYEFQMASMNRHLIPEVETLFLTPAEQYGFISSSLVREISRLGGDVSAFVPAAVAEALQTEWQRKAST